MQGWCETPNREWKGIQVAELPKFVSQGKPRASIAPRQRLEDEAYNAIRDMIISNELMGGQVISVVALADHLGVSRSPVTKAVAALEQDGFIESEPFKAPRVATVTTKFVRDVYDLRTVLEARSAANAVSNLSDADVATLTAGLASLERSQPQADPTAVASFDVALHHLFAQRADNKLLAGFLDNLELHLNRIRNVYKEHIYSEPETDMQLSELQAIVHAAVNRDAGAAEVAMRDHVWRHAQRLIEKIGGSPIS
ncbi:hypothetical protein PD653_4996 [Nocardioides sp. PD653]|nr:hypothetical protein PD653B2_1936 [Nocardioides sp. PD653-B2]GAW57551.1 hypothetical protein PD653_4996 [Nocardioides sp. PD653]